MLVAVLGACILFHGRLAGLGDARRVTDGVSFVQGVLTILSCRTSSWPGDWLWVTYRKSEIFAANVR